MKTTKTKNDSKPKVAEPNEDDVREYAYHLYAQSGYVPDRDMDNWLEARACLCACVPKERSHTRLHHHNLATRTIA